MSTIWGASNFLRVAQNTCKNLPKHARKLNTGLPSFQPKKSKDGEQSDCLNHPTKFPPEDYNPKCVEHEGFDVPDFIPAAAFRQFSSDAEVLGPGAGKCECYKNPEYYAYHRYSFVILQQACLELRKKCNQSQSGGKKKEATCD